jgi:polar amino acid transport system substrate-binding protein
MKPIRAWFIVLSALLSMTAGVSRSEALRYAVFSAPPFMILGEIDSPESDYGGIDLDIVREIARRMQLDVHFMRCPWIRCLRWLQEGRADLLTSAYKKPEREVFLEYFKKPYLESLPIAFYSKSARNYSITKYEDLAANKTIGVLSNASYFDRFDHDKDLTKFEVTSQDLLFPMLMYERFDLIAGYVPTENYRLVTEGYKGNIQKSVYEFSGVDPVYMALSKKSPLSKRKAEFDRINEELIQERFIKRLVESYYSKYQP